MARSAYGLRYDDEAVEQFIHDARKGVKRGVERAIARCGRFNKSEPLGIRAS
jgi:hypothetical protein